MRSIFAAFFLFLCYCATGFAQPRYSPGVRAKREIQWMQDTLHLTQEQANKITAISIDYERNMDKASHSPEKSKIQNMLVRKKNKAIKPVLNDDQYQKYLEREKMILAHSNIKYTGDRRPL
jgi:Spy/CpxP family protein refolding chaperone